MTSMIVWSQDVHGLIKMAQTRKKVLLRAKSADRVNMKSKFKIFASLQVKQNHEKDDSMECIPTDSSISYGSTNECNTKYNPWSNETNLH